MKIDADKLLQEQCNEWQQCADNYHALQGVEVRSLMVNGLRYLIQFNPKRIASSSAKVDAQSIKERKCFLCEANRPSAQKGIAYSCVSGNRYTVLVNPFPIFKRHLTIPSVDHQDQRIAGKMEDMLELVDQLPGYLLFYNGPQCGASAPDHFHFQAGNKGFLPIESNIEELLATRASALNENLYTLNETAAFTFIYKSQDPKRVSSWFYEFYHRFNELSNNLVEPMMNILAWKNEDCYYLVVYPRRAHRPSQYFASGAENILISPASIDFGGVFITPLKKDFEKLKWKDIFSILEQVTISKETFKVLSQW